MAWILCCNLKNCSINFCCAKVTVVLEWYCERKQQPSFRFAGTFITSILKEKGLFYIFLRPEPFNMISRIEAKSLYWLNGHIFTAAVFFFAKALSEFNFECIMLHCKWSCASCSFYLSQKYWSFRNLKRCNCMSIPGVVML